MKKIVSILLIVLLILAIFTLILFAEEIESTFQNEPDGFRGLKWGDAPTEDMVFFIQILSKDLDKGNIYHKKNEKEYIGSVKFFSIEYTFNLRSNQLYKVEATCSDLNSVELDRSYNILKIILEDKYGEPTRKMKYWLCWEGSKTLLYIYYNPGRGSLYLISESAKICPEDPPEINEQEEIEKAEEDL